MGKRSDHISQEQATWINEQKMFFTATAMKEGTINLSPKGMDTFRIMDKNRICWLNLTGSGNETATHLLESNRMTIMFCAFEGKPKILRLYGNARPIHTRDAEFEELISQFPNYPGKRQIIDMNVTLVQTSCGFGVPRMEYREDREILEDWALQKGPDGITAYWEEKNKISLDGHDTQILT